MFRYAPFDGSKQPFSIGLAPLAPERWFEPDERLLPELALKDALLAQKRDAVFAERDDTRDSQAEILDAIARHLLAHHGERFSLDDDAIVIDSGARRVNLSGVSPLLAASLLVQDDLCLMRQDRDGWRLVAASLCFPSSWSLGEKFDRPMSAIHRDVPGFPGRMETRVARIFDHLKPGAPVWRLNWSLYGDGDLHHPESPSGARRWDDRDEFEANAFIRVERQTLTKMPRSGDILFTIRVYADPVAGLRQHPRGRELAGGLRAQLLALDEAQLRYKNLLGDRDRAADALARLI